MSTERTTEARAQHPDRALRARMYKAIKNAVLNAWRECVEECVDEYTTHPPIYRWEGEPPDFLEYGKFYGLPDDDYAYDYIYPVALQVVDELFRKYRLGERRNAEVWRKWLRAQAYKLSWHYARDVDYDVAKRMVAKFREMYGLDFSFYLWDGSALFVLSDGEDLGDEWEVLADLHVRGRWRGDFDYLRVVYAYNATKMLLLCIHHEYVSIPRGGWALNWVLEDEWWDVTLEEAKEIVSEAVGGDEDEDEEDETEE